MEPITSRNNPGIKAVRALHRKAERLERGRFLVEGPKCVELALESDWEVQEIYFEESFAGKPQGRDPLHASRN